MTDKEIRLMKMKQERDQALKYKEYATVVRLTSLIDELEKQEDAGAEINRMPSNCTECAFNNSGSCDLHGKGYATWNTGTPPHCFLKKLTFEEHKNFVEWLESYDRWKK